MDKCQIYTLNNLADAVHEGKLIVTPNGTYRPEEVKNMSLDSLEKLLSRGAHYEEKVSKLQWII